MEIKTALIWPDSHLPYHDQRAIDLMLEASQDLNLSEIVLLGDFLDFYQVSSHGKHPGLLVTLEEELDCGKELLTRVREMHPKAKITYCIGNHEHRLERYLLSEAPALLGMIGLESLLRSWNLDLNIVPYGRYQKHRILNSKLFARHEPFSGGEHCAAGTVKKAGASVIFGHTHRIQEFQMVSMEGQNYRGISCGWLGDAKQTVFNYVKNHEQWAKAFAIVHVLPDGNFHCSLCHIIDYKVVVNGYLYSN